MSSRTKKIILLVIFVPLLVLGTTVGYFLNKIWAVSQAISFDYEDLSVNLSYNNPEAREEIRTETIAEETETEKQKQAYRPLNFVEKKKLPQRGTEERINVLLLGKASADYPGSNLTDTIILASINPQTYQGAMLSIPRDLYVNIPDSKMFTKINAVYAYGLKQGGHQKGMELLKRSIGEVTGQKIDYYVMIDFKAFEKIIDSLGGVDVNVEEDILDNRYPGPNYSYQTFSIEKGLHHLDGPTALKYVRVRHNAGGDFGRAKRQQQVLEALKEQFFKNRGVTAGLAFFSNLLDIIKDNVKTDIPLGDYLPFLFLAQEVNIHQVTNKVLDNSPTGVLESYNPVVSGVVAYTLRPKAGNYYQIQRIASFIFDLSRMERQDKARETESAKVAVISSPEYDSYKNRIKGFLQTQGYKIIEENIDSKTVHLWRLKEGARLPVVSEQNRKSLSSESYLEKLDFPSDLLKQTTIYDNAEGKKPFSLEDLVRRLGAQVSLYKEPQSQADFIVVVGGNVEQVFQKENQQFVLTEEGINQEKVEQGGF